MKTKSRIFSIGALALIVGLNTQAQSIAYKVDGKIGSYNSPAKVYLSYAQDGKRVNDSAELANGQFRFSGTIKEPVSAYLFFSDGAQGKRSRGDSRTIYLEKGSVHIVSKDSFSHAVIVGGPLNKENNLLQQSLKSSNEKISQLYADYTELSAEEKKDTAKTGPIERRIDDQEKIRKKRYLAFLKNHPASIVALDALKQYAGYNPEYDKVYPLYAKLSPAVRQSVAGKAYGERLANLKAVAIGNTAPDFTQTDTADQPVKLSSFRGKYVLVDFWASWCGPCRRENPNVVAAYNKFKDRNFTVLGVSLDQPNGREKWLKAIHDDHLTWTQVSDLKFWNNEVAKLYSVQSIPQNFLIDPQGKIIGKNLRGEDLEAKLSAILN